MTRQIKYSAVEFSKTLESSFIQANPDADNRYAPRFLTNDKTSGSNVLAVLKSELRDCVSFDFSVAFITSGGVQVLVELLSDLARRNVPGRILTSTYLNFNNPDALRKLLEYPNIKARVYQGDLHAKGYYFDKNGLSTVIIGSSNLTQTALTCNREWNVLFRSFYAGEFYQDAKQQFESVWNDETTTDITYSWIDAYESYRRQNEPGGERWQHVTFHTPQTTQLAPHAAPSPQTSRASSNLQPTEATDARGASDASDASKTSANIPSASAVSQPTNESVIKPNRMQTHALEALDALHRHDERRALLISATGTGKTYLSAFDVQIEHPKRVLFVAHRERILQASRDSFMRVLGDSYSYGIYRGESSHPTESCVFAMVNTLTRHLGDFSPREFDYLIIDEAHRTGANSYRKILEHFQPRFCLGMTATPARTDGYDVYNLFNHVIAYRITLNDALENEMLVPFHYFGIADLEIDDETVEDVGLFAKLTSRERVRHITSKIEEYTVDKTVRRGLVFCNRNDEAAKLSQLFNERGYRTVAISGATSNEDRNRAIALLEEGALEYIFSVDILNEGVDIPSLNQIIMLRRTESAIVFVQQLGRGLRKLDGKEYTLVLDFIGNYQQNYLIPIALSGDRSYNKDTLRRVVKNGSTVIPGASTITFDHISEARVFKALEQGRFSEAKLIRQEYEHLKQMLGHIPNLLDFDENESIDPLIIFKKYGSYAAFLEKYEPNCGHAYGKDKLAALKYICQKLASGKRRADLAVLANLVRGFPAGNRFPAGSLPKTFPAGNRFPEPGALVERPASGNDDRMRSVACVLSGAYSTVSVPLVRCNDNGYELSDTFASFLKDDAFRNDVLDCLEFGIRRNEKLYARTYKDTDFVLNAKYTREEVCRLLRWKKEPNYQNIGGYFHDKDTNTFPVFINYEKDPSISVTTMYEDRFVSERELIAISKSKRTLNSPEIVNLGNAQHNGMRCYLFVRKNKDDKDDGTEFYFLGEMYPTGQFRQFTMKGTTASAVEITYRLDVPVRTDLYDYFLSDLDV